MFQLQAAERGKYMHTDKRKAEEEEVGKAENTEKQHLENDSIEQQLSQLL